MNDCGQVAAEPVLATADQESWVRETIRAAMRMAVALDRKTRVSRHDEGLRDYGYLGIANGAAVEIMCTMGHPPSYSNIDRLGDELMAESCPT